MNPTRRVKVEDQEAMLQERIRQNRLPPNELLNERLGQLQEFIQQLAKTPNGRAELQQRTQRFGPCQRGAGDTVGQFYGRLRDWLDRDLG